MAMVTNADGQTTASVLPDRNEEYNTMEYWNRRYELYVIARYVALECYRPLKRW